MKRLAVLAAALVIAGCVGPTQAEDGSPLFVAAGDIACDPSAPVTASTCRHANTADLVRYLNPDVVGILGDAQYPDGELSDFQRSYDPTWGEFKSRTRPAPGNHEWHINGDGYFDYFGPAAGERGKGWYSYDLGSWHMIALNSNCDEINCAEQVDWLRRDLAASQAKCTLAYMHHPLFSSGDHGGDSGVRPLWDALHDDRADVILSGHDHDYERFDPLTPSGERNDQTGIRSFVVGSGGKGFRGFGSPETGSVTRNSSVFGVLAMRLGDGNYSWDFVAEAGRAEVYDDGASARCI